ncbi:MAG: hypothetical protein WAV20_24265 [Blastocatellia bacterium]
MTRRLPAVVLSVCCLVSILGSVQGHAQSVGKGQGIGLEINIVEITGSQTDLLQKLEKNSDQLNRFVAEGKARLIAGLQVRTRAGESFNAIAGQRVPIQTATLPAFSANDRARGAGPQTQTTSFAIPQIVYEEIGLIVEGTSTVTSDGLLDIRLKLSMTSMDRSTGNLTPTFTQRNFSNAVRMKASETAMVVSLIQPEGRSPSLEQIAGGATNSARGALVVLLTTKPVQ